MKFPQLFPKRNLGLDFLPLWRPLRVLAAVTYPTPSVATVISIRLAETTDLLIAFAFDNIRRYPHATAVSVGFDVQAAVLLPFTVSDLSIFVPTLHQDLRNEQRAKA
jgi:hypothetical protein